MSSPLSDLRASRHPIGVVVQRTGLTADVIRVWERRYGAVQPERDASGQRLYTDDDIERLRLLHVATRAGRSIGRVASLPTGAIAELVTADTAAREEVERALGSDADRPPLLDEPLALIRALDGSRLDAALRRAVTRLGVGEFIGRVAAPLLREIGDRWHDGRLAIAHEHLASSVLHGVITETMRALVPLPGAPRIVVATPAGERHAIGAAAVGATAAAEGWNVVYLGADLPAGEIAAAAEAADATLVAMSVVHAADRARVLAELRELRGRLPKRVALWVGGTGAEGLAGDLVPLGLRHAAGLEPLRDELRRLTAHRDSPAIPPS